MTIYFQKREGKPEDFQIMAITPMAIFFKPLFLLLVLHQHLLGCGHHHGDEYSLMVVTEQTCPETKLIQRHLEWAVEMSRKRENNQVVTELAV